MSQTDWLVVAVGAVLLWCLNYLSRQINDLSRQINGLKERLGLDEEDDDPEDD